MPAEFEPHDALLIGWSENTPRPQCATLAAIVKAAHQRTQIVVLVPRGCKPDRLLSACEKNGVDPQSIRLVEAPVDVPWVRDYGPRVIKRFGGGFECIDAKYDHPLRLEIRRDDDVPAFVAKELGMRNVPAPLLLDGGNLLSNGAGLCLTTKLTVQSNHAYYGYTPEKTTEMVRQYYGAQEVVFLEPLEGELTGHVDVFATFTAPDTVVVGKYNEEEDPINAAILVRNVERLRNIKTACGPLNVVRIPMPPRSGMVFPTYTNVVFVNGAVLVPVYGCSDPDGEAEALAQYRKLLPDWEIIEVDCESFMQKGGSLHCVTLNLFRTNAGESLLAPTHSP